MYYRWPGVHFNIKAIFPGVYIYAIGISIIKIRRSKDCLTFLKGIPILPVLVRRTASLLLILESSSWWAKLSSSLALAVYCFLQPYHVTGVYSIETEPVFEIHRQERESDIYFTCIKMDQVVKIIHCQGGWTGSKVADGLEGCRASAIMVLTYSGVPNSQTQLKKSQVFYYLLQ